MFHRVRDATRIWARSLAMLSLLAVSFLPCLFVCFVSWLLAKVRKLKTESFQKAPSTMSASISKSVLILAGSKGKALHLARLFKAAGYTTVVAEVDLFSIVATSWSNCVDSFSKLPNPAQHPDQYVDTVISLVKQHKPTFFIPIEPRHVKWDIVIISKISETSCMPLAFDEETFDKLDNKFTFCQLLEDFNLRAPLCQEVTNKSQVKKHMEGSNFNHFILKPVLYDARFRNEIHIPSDPAKMEAFLESRKISSAVPYVLQNRLTQPEYSSCTLVLGGQAVAHTVGNSSPVHQTMDDIHQPEVDQWVEDFLATYPRPLTGWITFDFMRSPEDGLIYPIECNPRVHSCFILFEKEDRLIELLEQSLLEGFGKKVGGEGSSKDSQEIQPLRPSTKQIYWIINELWVLLSSLGDLDIIKEHLHILASGREAVFDSSDPLPFLVLNFGQMPALIITNLVILQPFNIVDFCCSSLKC